MSVPPALREKLPTWPVKGPVLTSGGRLRLRRSSDALAANEVKAMWGVARAPSPRSTGRESHHPSMPMPIASAISSAMCLTWTGTSFR